MNTTTNNITFNNSNVITSNAFIQNPTTSTVNVIPTDGYTTPPAYNAGAGVGYILDIVLPQAVTVNNGPAVVTP